MDDVSLESFMGLPFEYRYGESFKTTPKLNKECTAMKSCPEETYEMIDSLDPLRPCSTTSHRAKAGGRSV